MKPLCTTAPPNRSVFQQPNALFIMKKNLRLLFLFACLSAFPARLLATAYTWNGGNANWSDPNEWSPIGIPGPGDMVTLNSGNCILDEDTEIAQLVLTGGTLAGVASAKTLTVTGTFNWSGGNLNGLGEVAVGGATTMTGSGTGTINTRKLTLNGGGAITGDAWRYGDNMGEIFVPVGQTLTITIINGNNWFGGGGLLNIAGTLVHIGPQSTHHAATYSGFPSWSVICTGAMNVTGNLHFGYSGFNGTFTGANITIAENSFLYFTGGLHTFNNCNISGLGRMGSYYCGNLLFQTGNVMTAKLHNFTCNFTIDQAITLGDVALYGGNLNGTGLKTITKSLILSGGNIYAPMKFSPNGTDIGTLLYTGSFYSAPADFDFDLSGNTSDKMVFSGNVTLDADDAIHIFPGTPPAPGPFVVLECNGVLSGTFGGANTLAGYVVTYDYTPGAGKVILNPSNCTLGLTPTTTAATCQQATNGAIALAASGGSGTYTYSWTGPGGFTSTNQNITGLAPGAYWVAVTDVNDPSCYGSQTIPVSVVNDLMATITAVQPTCDQVADGELSAVVSGCTGCTFDYEWHKNSVLIGTLPAITTLVVGNYDFKATTVLSGYTCLVVENGIALTPEYNLLAAKAVTAHVGCDAMPTGAVTLTASSTPAGHLNPPFSFDIGNGYATEDELTNPEHPFSMLAGGNYNVVITDGNGCQGTTTFNIAGPAEALSLSHTTTLICNNTPGNLDLTTVGGVPPFDFEWSNGAMTEDLTSILAGNHTVSVTYSYLAGVAMVDCELIQTIPVASAGAEPTASYVYPSSHLVSPLVGDPYSVYRFEIKYTDADNDAPTGGFPKLYIDKENDGTFERTIAMNPVDAADLTFSDGKNYFVEPSGLTAGTDYRSKIILRDDKGCETATLTLNEPDIQYLPDVYVFANDISFVPSHPDPGDVITAYATVHNPSDFDMTVVVRLESEFTSGDAMYNDQFPADMTVTIAARGSEVVSWSMKTPPEIAFVPMHVTVDATGLFMEPNELDNTAVRPFLNGDYNLPVDIVLTTSVTSHLISNNCFFHTVYRLNGSDIHYTGLPPGVNSIVSGAQVSFVWQGQTFTGNTDDNGSFSFDLGSCPDVAVGTHEVEGIEVTDFTVTSNPGLAEFVVLAGDCGSTSGCGGGGGTSTAPDYVSSVAFPTYAVVGQPVMGTFSVSNIGSEAAVSPSTTEVLIFGAGAPAGLSASTAALALSQGENYSGSLTFSTPGLFGLQSVADGGFDISETNESNNYSSLREIQVIPAEADLQPLTDVPVSVVPLQCLTSNLTFKVKNFGNATASNFQLHLEIFELQTSPTAMVLEAEYDQPVGNLTGWPTVNNTTTKIFQHQFLHNSQYLLRITADGGDVIAEYSEANNTRDFIVAVGECEGDLVVSSTCENFLVSPASPAYPGTITVNTRIKNTGPTAAYGPFKVRFLVNGTLSGTYTYNGTLNANTELPIAKQIAMPDPTMVNMLEVIVDSDHNVPEPLENNNSWTTNLYTDLILNLECNENPNPPPPAPQTIPYVGRFWDNIVPIFSPVNLWVRFKNEGNIRRSNVKVRYEMSGPGITGWQLLGTGTTPLGVQPCGECNDDSSIPQNTNYLSEPVEFSQAGTFQVRMTIDPDNVYAETDESLASNQLIVSVVAQNIPDMRTLSQYIAPSLLNPEEGETVNIHITFDNLGQYNVQDVFTVKLLMDDVEIGSVQTNGLAQGDHRTVAMPAWIAAGVGGHVMRAVIDADDEIAEASENNNEATRIIFVGSSPNLRFASFTADNLSPMLGGLVTFSAVLQNEGDLAGTATLKLFYQNDDGQKVEFYSGSVTVGANGSLTVSPPAWMVLDATTLITAEISGSVPEEYYTGDNSAHLTLNGLTFDLAVNNLACGAQIGSATVANIAGGSGDYSVSWFSNDAQIGSGATSPDLIPNASPNFYQVKVQDNNNVDLTVIQKFNLTETLDATAPVITCPASLTVCTSPAVNQYIGTGALNPTVTDNCSTLANVSYQFTGATTGTGAGTAAGKAFNLNATTIRYTVTDAGGSSSCSLLLTVRKSPLPYWQPPTSNPPVPVGAMNLKPYIKDYRSAAKTYKIYLGAPTGTPVCTMTAVNGVVSAGQNCWVTHSTPGLYQYYAVAINDYATGLDCEFVSGAFPVTVVGPGQTGEGDITLGSKDVGHTAPVLFPNPTDGLLNVLFEGGEQDGLCMMFYDTNGRLVMKSDGTQQPPEPNATAAIQQFDLSQLSGGVYLFRLVVGGQQYTGRVVKID